MQDSCLLKIVKVVSIFVLQERPIIIMQALRYLLLLVTIVALVNVKPNEGRLIPHPVIL